MKRLLLGITLAVFASAASAQGANALVSGLNNIDNAVNALVTGAGNPSTGFLGAGAELLNGNVTQTFNNGNIALQDFVATLVHGTPAEPLAAAYVDTSNAGYAALLPLYQALDGPARSLTSALSPVTDPLAQAMRSAAFDFHLDFHGSGLPGLAGLLGDASLPGIP